MRLSYKFKILSSELKSDFIATKNTMKSDLYLNKDFGWFEIETNINTKNYSFLPMVYDIKSYNTKTTFKTNTENVEITNIFVEGKPYFYKINIKGINSVNEKVLVSLLNTKDIISYNGDYFTNTKSFYSDTDSVFIYTSPTIDIDKCSVSYKSKYIEITAPPKCYIRTFDFIINPSIINQYSFYIPSFYIQDNKNKLIRCIESNRQFFELSEDLHENSYLKYKVESIKENEFVIKNFNISLKEAEEKTILYRKSSHCFNIFDDYNFFKIVSDGSIIKSNSEDYDFIIKRKINIDKIDIIPNTYKQVEEEPIFKGGLINQFQEKNTTYNDFGIKYNFITDEKYYNHYISNPDFNYFFTSSNYKVPVFMKYKSLYEDAIKLDVISMEENDELYTTVDSLTFFTVNRKDAIPTMYYLISSLYAVESAVNSSKTLINSINIKINDSKKYINASADVYASSVSNLLSLDSKKVISYTKVDSDELDTYGSSSNNLLSIDLIDYIRYTKHTLKTETYGATTANLLSLNVVSFPLVHYNLSETTKTTISKIIIGVT